MARSEATAAEFVAVLGMETAADATARPARATVAKDNMLADDEVHSGLIR